MSNLSTAFAVAHTPAIGAWGIAFSLIGGVAAAMLEKNYIEDMQFHNFDYDTHVSFVRMRATGVLVASALAVGINFLYHGRHLK